MEIQGASQFGALRSIGGRIYFAVAVAIGMLVLVLVLNSANSTQVASVLDRVAELRAPTALQSNLAEEAMLKMLVNIRGYLALGEQQFIDNYEIARDDFEESIVLLDTLSTDWTNPVNLTRLETVRTTFTTWGVLPQQMFDLRDDPIANQPAQAILVNEGAPRIASVQTDITSMIDVQAVREPTVDNTQILKDMADFRGSWNGMAAGIRGYLANLNPLFLDEYTTALATNTDAWNRMLGHPREEFTTEQLVARDNIATTRAAFLPFPQQMFDAATSDRAREDLFLLSSEAVPQAAIIVSRLEEMVFDQEDLLEGDIALSQATLATGQQNTQTVGVIALIVSAGLAFIIIGSITRPLSTLTGIASDYAAGDLSRRSTITSRDEVGALSDVFNSMAQQVEDLVDGLEERIAERTRDMETVVEVSNQIATILDVDRLIQDVVDLTKERFGLYHAHAYLIDEDGETLRLTAGAGHVGRQMVSEIRTIEVSNRQSIVATAARTRRGSFFNDVASSPEFLAHPLLPNTRSELAVPLIARGQVLGVLDVQGDEVDYFSEETLNVLEILASQIASALSNATLFAVADRTSRHEQALGVIDRQIQQAADVDEVLQITVRELGKALRVPHTTIELQIQGNEPENV